MGRLPILLIALPDEGDHFAADALLAAWRLVIKPVEVDRIAVPRPPRTRGRRSLRA